LLGIELGKSCLSWPVPDEAQVEKFNRGEPSQDCPNVQDLRLDWFAKGLTDWTKHSAIVFAEDFCAAHGRGAYPLVQVVPTERQVVKLFEGYVTYLKRKYIAERANPLKAAKAKQEADRKSRSLNRREQVCTISP
jgi:hypothetical protein